MRFSDNSRPRFNTPLTLTGPKLIISDVHAPFHSALWMNRLLSVSKETGIRDVVIAGDALDLASFSGWGADPELSWTEEEADCADWLWQMYHSFDNLTFFRGNHSDRISRITNWQMKVSTLLNAMLVEKAEREGVDFQYKSGKMIVSGYPYCYLDQWMIVHPGSYSRIPLRVVSQLAINRMRPVIAAHSHKAGESWADNGMMVIDSGGLFDEDKIQYRHKKITTHGAWVNGFVVYHGPNYVQFMGPEPQTNWAKYD